MNSRIRPQVGMLAIALSMWRHLARRCRVFRVVQLAAVTARPVVARVAADFRAEVAAAEVAAAGSW